MPLEYVTIRESDFGSGIDQQSAENKIPEGYCEDLQNVDPQPTGFLSKRTGYQGYAGYVPVRCRQFSYISTGATENLKLVFDSSIEIPFGRSQPIIVYGKTSSENTNNEGDFPNDTTSINYYSGFVSDIRQVIPAGSNQDVVREQEDHGISTEYMTVRAAESTSETAFDHEQIYPDVFNIDISSKDITATFDNNSGSAKSGYIFAKDRSEVAGSVYHSLGNSVPFGGSVISIPAATHGLIGTNISAEVYINDAINDLFLTLPESVTVNEGTGEVIITLGNDAGPTYDADIILYTNPTINFREGAIAPLSPVTITIDASVTGGSPFAAVTCYLDPGTGVLEQVLPDSIAYDVTSDEISVTFQNNSNAGANFEIYWDFIPVATNSITVTADSTVSSVFDDTNPQITLYGLCHEEIYGEEELREGWVTHVDSYRAEGDNRLVCGLGGNLFAARLRSEGSNATTYNMPQLFPNLRVRLASDTNIAPAFFDTGDVSNRTRGYITGDNGANNFFTISSITYNSGTGYMDYVLDVPNLSINGVLTDIISSTSGLEDRLTCQQCGYSRHNGVFVVKNVIAGVDQLTISVENPDITSLASEVRSSYDEVDVGGEAGVFTDRLVFTSASPFQASDILDSDLFAETTIPVVLNSVGTTVLLQDINSTLSLPNGLRLVGQRTSSVVPLRDSTDAANVQNIVRGDMLSYTNTERQLRVKSINPLADISITIEGDGSNATVTLGSGDTSSFFVGQKLLISGSSNFNGEHTITSIESTTAFKTDNTVTATNQAAVLEGKTVEVDESFTFKDTTTSSEAFEVFARWIPIESPEDTFDITPKTRQRYFDSTDYDNQNFIRSTMVQDNLYLTNSSDEVLKFDGVNIYRAGLFRWQPNLFFAIDEGATGKIIANNPTANVSSEAQNQFTVGAGEARRFRIGNDIKHSADAEIYTIEDIDTDNDIITVNKLISGSGGTLTRVRSFNYYFRLNAIDINDNIVASAITGSEDSVIEIAADAAINIKVVGLPIWDIYDYARLEVEIYRTKADSPAPFYKLTTLAMSFNNSEGYIEYTDTDADDDLIESRLDKTSVLKGQELGTAFTEPMRGKYVTSAGNKLILGNVTDYPQMDIQILKNKTPTLTSSTFITAGNSLWQFRKDSTSSATGTDMVNTARYEFVNTFSGVSGISSVADTDFTVNVPSHGQSVGSWIYLHHNAPTSGDDLEFAGWWQVSSVLDANNFKVNFSKASGGVATNFPSRVSVASSAGDIPVFLGTDGNYSQFNGNRSSTEAYEFLAMKRLAEAINCSMRMTDKTLSGQTNFEPWMIANAGNEYNVGQLVIRQPKIFDTSMEVVVPSLANEDFFVFGNNINRTGGSSIGALARQFPSRIIVSYNNYPEVFDAPTATIDTESDSAIDINPADGQEITSIIPFFGDAAFGAAQKSSIVVVFKTNSIYLVDLSVKDRLNLGDTNAGSPVQKLETQGKGCTAPASVSVTKNGIMFVNETGIYRLNRNLSIDFIGRKYDRKFNSEVNSNTLDLVAGHNSTFDNKYKVSYALSGETKNSQVAVYNHTREYERQGNEGSWTTYTNHPVTGWANLDSDSFFASTQGRVYQIRRTGSVEDFRDDDAAIPMTILTRAIDGGDSGRRKVFGRIITHYRVTVSTEGTTLQGAMDLSDNFQDSDVYTVNKLDEDNFSDTGNFKVITVSSVFDRKMGVYIQLKYTNNAIDEPVEITSIDIRTAAKTHKGMREAADT